MQSFVYKGLFLEDSMTSQDGAAVTLDAEEFMNPADLGTLTFTVRMEADSVSSSMPSYHHAAEVACRALLCT
jgi:hypothetical protein